MRIAEVEVASLRDNARGEARRLPRSALAVAALVLLIYGAWVAAYLLHGGEALDFTATSLHFLLKSHASPVIRFDPTYHGYIPADKLGYDGQFAYFLALDPINARYYIDVPAYRYGRILYPMVARLLALGQPGLVPYTLILVNLLALAGGTLVVATWLRRKRLSPWLALLFGVYPGLFIAFQRDLNEPLAYALAALGVYLFDFGGRRRLLWAGLAFGLAALAREATLVFPFVYGVALLLRATSFPPPVGQPFVSVRAGFAWLWARLAANWRSATLFGALAAGPILLYKVFLFVWLGSGVPQSVLPELIPFQGLFAHWPFDGEQVLILEGIVAPGLLALAVAVWALRRSARSVALWALLGNVVVFVILLNQSSYSMMAAGRVTAGVPLATLFCLPAIDALTKRTRTWLVACGLLWMSLLPWWLVFPFVLKR
jgi:hypothetical protein